MYLLGNRGVSDFLDELLVLLLPVLLHDELLSGRYLDPGGQPLHPQAPCHGVLAV